MAPGTPPAKTTPKKKVTRPPTNHPTTLAMVRDAIEALKEPKGVPAVRIKNYICEKYKDIDPNSLKYRLRQALTKGLEKGIIAQTKLTVDKPVLMSRFKLVKQKPEKKEKKATETKKKTTTKEKTVDKKKAVAKKSPKKSKTTDKTKESKAKTKKVKTPVKKVAPSKQKTAKPKAPKTPKTPKTAKTAKKTVKK